MTSSVLRSIVEQLEAYYLIRHNDYNQEVREAYKELGLIGKLGDEIGEPQIDPPIMVSFLINNNYLYISTYYLSYI